MMKTMERKKPRARRSFTPEFKAEVVALVRQTGKTAGGPARCGGSLLRPGMDDHCGNVRLVSYGFVASMAGLLTASLGTTVAFRTTDHGLTVRYRHRHT